MGLTGSLVLGKRTSLVSHCISGPGMWPQAGFGVYMSTPEFHFLFFGPQLCWLCLICLALKLSSLTLPQLDKCKGD